ncbi:MULTISPECIES: hypothetical protein [Vibrio]|uniref:Hydroxylamine reductase n=1 Tax=Vibrio aestuarianus TaxID=28171 RepID=A0A7X6N9H5_9VIBR|nr:MULTISPECIES: hypothetical protein [Vibrio]KOE82089.1 hydroxylamine reductase [Vibrio alginolyticus]MDE1211014.1 hypothetical protein [Vibrio aestuarianus]MDE1213466.1 hypothetical protein [Vibrio aestuarianus]MDE1219126.1 hypothetical protein [Vibrio aestuarianus]MDE1222279.1 hypothetical protein [Vibrio aestuarianus]
MNRFLITALTLITGFFALIFSLILAIPLTIAAIITGKRLEKQLKGHSFYQRRSNVIDGEYEDVTTKHSHQSH